MHLDKNPASRARRAGNPKLTSCSRNSVGMLLTLTYGCHQDRFQRVQQLKAKQREEMTPALLHCEALSLTKIPGQVLKILEYRQLQEIHQLLGDQERELQTLLAPLRTRLPTKEDLVKDAQRASFAQERLEEVVHELSGQWYTQQAQHLISRVQQVSLCNKTLDPVLNN